MQIDLTGRVSDEKLFDHDKGAAPTHVLLAALRLDPQANFDHSIVEYLGKHRSGEGGTTWRFAWVHDGFLGIVETSSRSHEWTRFTQKKVSEQDAETLARLIPLQRIDSIESKMTRQQFEDAHNHAVRGFGFDGNYTTDANIAVIVGGSSVLELPLVPDRNLSDLGYHPDQKRDRERGERFIESLVNAWRTARK